MTCCGFEAVSREANGNKYLFCLECRKEVEPKLEHRKGFTSQAITAEELLDPYLYLFPYMGSQTSFIFMDDPVRVSRIPEDKIYD